jgi:hypothetical protein
MDNLQKKVENLFVVSFSSPEKNVVRNMDIMDRGKVEWKKNVSERLIRRMMKQREDRMNSIRLKKEEIINELLYDQHLDLHLDEKTYFLLEIYDKYESLLENLEEYHLETFDKWHISTCLNCSYPVVLCGNMATCVNLCFQHYLPENLISRDYSMDNFVEELFRVWRKHDKCFIRNNSAPEVLIFEDNVEIVCGYCFKQGTFD